MFRPPKNLPYSVGDLVRISTQSKSKGSGTVGRVIKITTQMIKTGTGFSAGHKYIDRVTRDSDTVQARTQQEPKEMFTDLLTEINSNRTLITELRRDVSEMKIDFKVKVDEIITLLNNTF